MLSSYIFVSFLSVCFMKPRCRKFMDKWFFCLRSDIMEWCRMSCFMCANVNVWINLKSLWGFSSVFSITADRKLCSKQKIINVDVLFFVILTDEPSFKFNYNLQEWKSIIELLWNYMILYVRDRNTIKNVATYWDLLFPLYWKTQPSWLAKVYDLL